ncbi:unnamed protein product [Ceratitis capitata]|uniref:(Mediterranean fruit fly) hypothetical protein n=1 Tax=Ceratitis capitata TaxID=7213 RepID=A0A811UBU1_CERCA|nr:unnamed protein product [Ceratitis capitata]
MVVDDRSMTNANKRLSIIQSMEMDISKEENVTLQTINNVEMVNDEEIETITRSFKDQLSSITFESMDNGKKTNKRKSTNKNVTMDISMNVEEPVKLQDVLNTEPQEYKYSDLVEEDTSLPHPFRKYYNKNITCFERGCFKKFGTSDKKVLSEEIPELQNHQPICEDSIIKSKSDGLGLTVTVPQTWKLIGYQNNMKPEVHNRECFENVADKINERSSADCTENEDMVSDSTSFLVKEKVAMIRFYNTIPYVSIISTEEIQFIEIEAFKRIESLVND